MKDGHVVEDGRMYTGEDREADEANEDFERSSDGTRRSRALERLGRLAEAGSVVAQYRLGEIFYGGPDKEDKRRGLRSHIRAAESGFLRSLVAIQKHEDPCLLKFDLLRDPTPLGLPSSVVSEIWDSRYARIALLADGIGLGVSGYKRDMADQILDEVDYAPALAVKEQELHLLALSYGLLCDHFDQVRAQVGPGSRVAIEENQAIAAGFRSWGDRKAHEHIARSETLNYITAEVAARVRDYKKQGDSPIPYSQGKNHSIKVDFSADRLIHLVCKLGGLGERRRGIGVDLLTGLLWFFAVVELGFSWEMGQLVARDLSNAYRQLGGLEGLASYMTRLFSTSASVRFSGEISPHNKFHRSTYQGEHLGSGSKKEVLILHSRSSRFERREESWGTSQIYIPNNTNIQSTYNDAYVTNGRFFLSFRNGKACLSLFNEGKYHETRNVARDVNAEDSVKRRRSYSSVDVDSCTRTEENKEPVNDFLPHEFFPIDNLVSGQRVGDELRENASRDREEAGASATRDLDDEVENARLNQLAQSSRALASQSAKTKVEEALERVKGLNAALVGLSLTGQTHVPQYQQAFSAGTAMLDAAMWELLAAMQALTAREQEDSEWRRKRAMEGFRRRQPPEQA